MDGTRPVMGTEIEESYVRLHRFKVGVYFGTALVFAAGAIASTAWGAAASGVLLVATALIFAALSGQQLDYQTRWQERVRIKQLLDSLVWIRRDGPPPSANHRPPPMQN
jgi:hypothetical protein